MSIPFDLNPNPMSTPQPMFANPMSMMGLADMLAPPQQPKSKAPYFRKGNDALEEIRKWSNRDINFWEPRNSRFQKDQETFQLRKPGDLGQRNDADIILLNDPRVLVLKLARLLARHPAIIEVPPAPGVRDTTLAQRQENFLYQWDQAQNQRWMMGLNNPYRFDQAFSAVLRGWITERTLLVPDGADRMQDDPSALWDHQVIDPALVFPSQNRNEICRVTHQSRTTCGEVRYDPLFGGKIPDWLEDCEDDREINVTAVYWRDANKTWWHAVLGCSGAVGMSWSQAEAEWLKKPVELGYNPWTILLCNGVSYRQTPWDWDQYISEIGTGALHEVSDTYTYLNRLATKFNELVSLEANPPAALYTQNGEIKEVDLRPGGRNYLTAQGDKVDLLRTGPRADSYQILWDILQKRADRAGLPGAFFAEYGGEGGFSASVLMAAGKDILFPYTEALNQADALKYRKVLELYRDFGPAQPLRTFTEDSNGKTVSGAELDWHDIKTQGTFVKISREDMTPQEVASRINLGLAMLSKQAISMETMRRDYAKIQNPRKENRQVLSEMVYMNPAITQALVPMALAESGEDAMLKLWEAVQNGPVPQAPGQPPGPPPQGGMGDIMNQGLPSQTLAPQSAGVPPQVQNRMDPNAAQNPLLALLQGGAQGGAGGGGTPPPQGSTGFVPQINPFFRPQ